MRKSIMRLFCAGLAALTLVLVGCGGGGGGGGIASNAQVSGVVFDNNGNAIKGATIYISDFNGNVIEQTLSDSNGAYVLKHLPPDYVLIQGQIANGTTTYLGENLALLSPNQRTMSLNLALYPSTMLASLSGTVSDLNGNLLTGAKVFATPPAGGPSLTSSYTVTDSTGHFFMGSMLAGVAYTIQANGLGYNSAFDTKTLTAGQTTTVAYSLPPATNTTLAAPTNVTCQTFTEPAETTTPSARGNALAAFKSKMFPAVKGHIATKTAKKMVTFGNGSMIEADLQWTAITNTSLLGFGVYRSTGGQPLNNIDFFRDPLAQMYEDMDPSLTVGTNYTYGVTTISTGFNNTSGESVMSNTVQSVALGSQDLGTVTPSANPTFSWQPTTGAATYAIYIYNTYPNFGVADIFDDFSANNAATTFTYSGAALASGTYYYYIVGVNQGGGINSFSISNVGSFSVP